MPIAILMDTLSIAFSGLQSADVRVSAAAHNLANATTGSFRPIRVVQHETVLGGSTTRTVQASRPTPIDLGHQTLELSRASIQYTASLRLIAVEDELRGQLTNVLA